MSHRIGSDLVLLWLWWRPATVAPTGPLAWESPYASGTALKNKAKTKKQNKKIHLSKKPQNTKQNKKTSCTYYVPDTMSVAWIYC